MSVRNVIVTDHGVYWEDSDGDFGSLSMDTLNITRETGSAVEPTGVLFDKEVAKGIAKLYKLDTPGIDVEEFLDLVMPVIEDNLEACTGWSQEMVGGSNPYLSVSDEAFLSTIPHTIRAAFKALEANE